MIEITESALDKMFENWYNEPNEVLYSFRGEYINAPKNVVSQIFKAAIREYLRLNND